MGEAKVGGPSALPTPAPGGTVLVSQKRGAMLLLVIALGVCAAIGALAITAVLLSGGDAGTARVVGPAPGRSDRTRIVVLDGPDPKAWNVPSDEVDAAPGEVIDVVLQGDCDCVPYPDRGDPGLVLILSMFLIGIFIPVLVNHIRNRRSQVNQARAARLLTADAPVTPVLLVPSIRYVRKRVAVRARVVTAGGVDLGELDLGRPRPAFNPTLRWWLVGEVRPGAVVALVSEARRQVLLPSSPLQAPTEAPAWSAATVTRLGWDAPPTAPEQVLVLPSQGRVAVPAAPGGPTEPSASDRQQMAQVTRSARWQLLAGFAGIVVVMVFVNVLQLHPLLVLLVIVAMVPVLSRLMNRRLKASVQGSLDLEPDEEPYAVEIASSLAAWQNRSAAAPAFHRTLPIGAV